MSTVTDAVIDHFTERFASAPPKRYFASTVLASSAPATGVAVTSVVSTRKSGRRYAATRKLPPTRFSHSPCRRGRSARSLVGSFVVLPGMAIVTW